MKIQTLKLHLIIVTQLFQSTFIKYAPFADALYIKIKEGRVVDSKEIDEGVSGLLCRS
ncbi:DUF2283 domain-containing protein [Desulfurococcaceae archaeon MEX13E-LK6-19]|nr:DUF2283 domain-containing protein [Desulfurococcaceae archaeon MEX13E-LK6-19]